MSKRKLFIGCSREAINVAKHIETLCNTKLTNVETVVWDFKPNWKNASSTLGSLVNITNEFYYAIFVFHPDDLINFKGTDLWATRDNVLFEAGLFFSKFGGERTFILQPYLLKNNPTCNNFRNISDLDGLEFSKYKLDFNTTISKWEFDASDTFTNTSIDQIFTDIINKETELNISSAQVDNEIDRVCNILEFDLKKINENDEFYLSAFTKNFDNLLRFKSKQIGRPVNHILTDIVISVNKINDVLDISQLADEQSKILNPKLDVVWVFADDPLEFKVISIQDPLKPHFDKLRTTILDNLSKGVKYVYFVNTTFDTDNLDSLVGTSTQLLSNIEIIKCDKKVFLTFLTLHFETNQKKPSEIYVSFVDKKRNDLLIKIPNSNQIKEIHDNLKTIKGKSEITPTYHVFDRTN